MSTYLLLMAALMLFLYYWGGGNVNECFASGMVAGQEANALDAWSAA